MSEAEVETDRRGTIRWFVYVCGIAALVAFARPFTHISRKLPLGAIDYYADHALDDIQFRVPVYIYCENLHLPDLAEAVQIQVNHQMKHSRQERVVDWTMDVRAGKPEGLDEYVLKVRIGTEDAIFVDNSLKYAELFVKMESFANNDVPFFVTQTLLFHIFNAEIESQFVDNYSKVYDSRGKFYIEHDRDDLVIDYGSDLKVAFTLVSPDTDWEVSQAMDEYFEPFKYMLKPLVNLTVETQIVYSNMTLGEVKSALPAQPGLVNFVVYPMAQEEIRSLINDSNSFMLPHSAIYLYPLENVDDGVIRWQHMEFVMEEFAASLFKFLDVVKHPKSPKLRVDITKRMKIVFNLLKLSENLLAISRLKHRIPDHVVDLVYESLLERNSTVTAVQSQDWNAAMWHSNLALKHSNSAFFDKNLI